MARRMASPPPTGWEDRRRANVVARTAKPGKTPDRGPKTVTNIYTVTGNRPVFGISPGDSSELTLEVGVAQSLIEAGHLAIAETSSEGR